jgi:ribosome recycling factor
MADQAEKDKDLPEDDADRVREEIQELTKTYESKVNDLAKAREKDVMDD